jgi:hypothetical protein
VAKAGAEASSRLQSRSGLLRSIAGMGDIGVALLSFLRNVQRQTTMP